MYNQTSEKTEKNLHLENKNPKTMQLYTIYNTVCFEIYKYCTSSFFRGRIYIQIHDINTMVHNKSNQTLIKYTYCRSDYKV